jgi:hypothetical protein
MYMGLFCLPWFLMYGVSSIAFSHPDWFPQPAGLYDTTSNTWTELGSWPCTVVVPETGRLPEEVGTELVQLAGLDDKAYGTYRAGERQVEVYFPAFWEFKRLTYNLDEQRLYLFTRDRVMQQTLTGMHARGGYHHDSFFDDAWAIMVDAVMIAFILWVISGFIIWWQLLAMRWWGAAALIAGLLSFAAFMLWL